MKLAVLAVVAGLLAATACSDGTTEEPRSADEVRFLVVHEGGQSDEEEPEALSVAEAKSRAEERVEFEFALPTELAEPFEPVELQVWLNPAAPLPLLRRGVVVTYASNPTFDNDGNLTRADSVLTLDIGHPLEGPLQGDGGEVVNVPDVGAVVISGGDGAYLWLLGEVRYRLSYEQGKGHIPRAEALAMIESMADR